MPEYTHEVFRPQQEGSPVTHYYHKPTKSVYNLKDILVNEDWAPDGKWWNIRPININLENK